MGAGKSSVRHTFNSHRPCGDCITRRRPPVRIGGSVFGRDRHAGSNAVNSRRDSVDFDSNALPLRRWVLWPARSWQVISRGIFWCSQRWCLCWGPCAVHFAWREPRIGMRASRSPLSCLFRVHTLAWIVALHSFFEVSVGILVALAVVAVWSERQPESAKQNAE